MKKKISVLCICYNHANYIEKSLNGILDQKLDFELDLIIYDDCSTDNSRAIIDDIVDNYRGDFNIRRVYPEVNQFSQGITVISFLFPFINGDYIAVCEGDDYWCDNLKIKKQVDILDENRTVDACFHPSMTLINNNLEDNRYGFLGDNIKVVPYQDIIMKGGGMMPLASIVFRSSTFLDMTSKHEKFFRHECYHSILQAVITLGKGAIYIPDKMSVYRSMHEGSWSLQQKKDKEKRAKEFKKSNKRLWKLNKIYKNRYFLLFLKLYYKKNVRFYKDRIKSIFR